MIRYVCSNCGQAAGEVPARCPGCGVKGEAFRASDDGDATTLEEARGRAREKLKNICAVYPFCDGDHDRICQRENYGKAIGMGGAGLGRSFRANVEALDALRLVTRVVGDHFAPDTSIELFGETLSMPILGASTSGMGSYNEAVSELEFCRSTILGCAQAGTLSMRGETYYYTTKNHVALDALEECEGRGIPIFKPRAQDDVRDLIARAEAALCPAVGVDLDGCGSTNFVRSGQPVFRKSVKDIRELVAWTSLPFIAKGIMCVEDAEACAEAGVAAVVVSNHGGRVLDSTPGTAEVLGAIVERLKGGKTLVLVDGGVRNGYDVIKMLALGAKAVLVGRDLIRAAIGGGAEGVRLQMEHLRKTLAQAMLMTGKPTVDAIDASVLSIRK